MNKLIQLCLVSSILLGILYRVDGKTFASNPGCQPTFLDEFNGPSLDVKKWNTQYPSGNGGEQQFYAPDAFTFQDGTLKINAQKRSMQGYPYTSGIITTQGRFSQQYGFFTIRVKLPKGQGFWPAFWMLPVKPDYPTELDIFEMLGGDSTTIYMSNHWKDANGENQKSIISFQGPDFSTGFHTFSLLWTPNLLIWYVDGIEQNRTDQGVPNKPMFLLVNLAVGGQWPGNPDQTTVFPNSMEIDYIRVYKSLCNFNLPFVSRQSGFFNHGDISSATTPGKYHN